MTPPRVVIRLVPERTNARNGPFPVPFPCFTAKHRTGKHTNSRYFPLSRDPGGGRSLVFPARA